MTEEEMEVLKEELKAKLRANLERGRQEEEFSLFGEILGGIAACIVMLLLSSPLWLFF